MPDPKIDPRFQELMRPLSPDEHSRLRSQIEADGCLVPLVVWSNAPDGPTLVDGHNRLGICRDLGIEFSIVEREFDDHDHVVVWIIDHQLARRNLTPREYRYWVGKRYEAEKRDPVETLAQNAPRGQSDPAGRTRDRIAAQTGLSAKSVQRAFALTQAVDQVSQRVGVDLKGSILNGSLQITDGDILKLAERDDITSIDQVEEFAQECVASRRPRPSSPPERPFITRSVKSYTTTIDEETGEELIESWVLSCEHVVPAKRRTPVRETHQKTAPCPDCGSGTRTPFERRRTAEAFDAAFARAFKPPHLEAKLALVRASIMVATLGPMDGRITQLRGEIGDALRELGVMAIDAHEVVA